MYALQIRYPVPVDTSGEIAEAQQPQTKDTQETIADTETGIGVSEDDVIANMFDEDNNIISDYEIVPMEEQVGYIVSSEKQQPQLSTQPSTGNL